MPFVFVHAGVVEGGLTSRLEISIPMVASDHEIEHIAPHIHAAASEEARRLEYAVPYHIATSLEVPRACVRADAIAREYDISSVTIDTDSLTGLMFGFDKHDCQKFLSPYLRKNILAGDPFECIDQRGVGSLMELALHKIRHSGADGSSGIVGSLFQSSEQHKNVAKREKGKILVGVCGEHGGNPNSVAYFNRQKVDFICVPPGKISACLISAAKAAVKESKARERAATVSWVPN